MFSSHSGERRLYRIEEIPERLSEGDYTLDGYETLSAMDTKRSLDELRKNLLDTDKVRAGKALRRLAERCKYPYVVLDMTPAEFNRKSSRCLWPDVVQDEVFKELGKLGIGLLWLPTGNTVAARKQLGEYMLRIMLGHVAAERELARERPPTANVPHNATAGTAPGG